MPSDNSKTLNEIPPIDLSELASRIWQVICRTWLIIIAAALVTGGVYAYRAKKAYVPRYAASAFFSVDSGYSESDIFSSSYYDSRAAEQLAASFPYLINTGVMSDLICEQLGRSSMGGSISAAAVADSGMLIMVSTSTSPDTAYEILLAAIDCYPQLASYMVDDPQLILREEPTVPTTPANSFSYKGPFLKGTLIGGGAVFAIAAVIALCTHRIGDSAHLKRVLNRPVVSVLPLVQEKKRRRSSSFTALQSDEALGEGIKRLCHKILRRSAESTAHVVLVTSTQKGEGKTTVAANLALAAASEGHRVALIDADLRNQSVAERLGAPSCRRGLLKLSRERDADVTAALECLDSLPLYYLSSDSVEGNRYSLEHGSMKRIVSALRRDFDLVIIDTPPCSLVADTSQLCKYADTVLYVVRAGVTSQTRLISAVDSLCERGGKVDALVLNGADAREHRYGYGYGYGYKYGRRSRYGYGYGRTKK